MPYNKNARSPLKICSNVETLDVVFWYHIIKVAKTKEADLGLCVFTQNKNVPLVQILM